MSVARKRFLSREEDGSLRDVPVPVEFLRKEWQQKLLICSQVKVVAGQHPKGEGARGLRAPSFEIFAADIVVHQTAERGQRDVQRRLGGGGVSLYHLEIRAHERQDDLHQLRVLEHLGGRAFEPPEFLYQLRLGQFVRVPLRLMQLRRAASRDEQVDGQRCALES